MIREANIDDLNEILSINNSCTENFLNMDNIKRDLIKNPFSQFLIYIIDNKIVAFVNYLIMYEKAEIANIAVIEQLRGQGIASKLMEYVINKSIQNNCENITLEVRRSNHKAIGLYQKFGFKEIAIREKYYGNEDGILMEKKLVL
jgi:ribosomal-protein-alanine N-acetyltransferase